MADTVTYRGATDGTESDVYTVLPPPGEEGEIYRFPVDQPVSDVPEAVVDQLEGVKGHHFDVGSVKASAGEPYTGYDSSSAEDVVKNLEATADHELAAEVLAYEEAHKGRKTILEAAKAQAEPEVVQGP